MPFWCVWWMYVTLQSCKHYHLLSLCGCLFEGCVWWMYVILQSCKYYHLYSLCGCLFDVCGECTSHCNYVNTIICCLFVDAFLMCVCGECTSHCNHVNTIICCLFVDAFLMCVCGECTSHCNHVNTIICCLFVDAFLRGGWGECRDGRDILMFNITWNPCPSFRPYVHKHPTVNVPRSFFYSKLRCIIFLWYAYYMYFNGLSFNTI